jgi:hypothetical protein
LDSGVQVGEGSGACTTTACDGNGETNYTLTVHNTSDNSDRLRILHNSVLDGGDGNTHTWINVTTGHTRANLVDLPGTVVLNYDVSGPAAQLSSTAVAVYLVDSGENSTNNAAGLLSLVTTGNARAGVVDLDDGSSHIYSRDLTTSPTFGTLGEASSVKMGVAFKITHAAADRLSANDDYAIAADFCNFDQNNGSLVHNCIYRIEAEETDSNTKLCLR